MHSGLHGYPELPNPALQGAVVLDGQVDAQADSVVGALRPPPTEQPVEVYPAHLGPVAVRVRVEGKARESEWFVSSDCVFFFMLNMTKTF